MKAKLSPPQLFVGTKTVFQQNEECEEYEDEVWLRESTKQSYAKLKHGIESLGIKVLNITFGEYDPVFGVLHIQSIDCEYDGQIEEHKELYIHTGITCFTEGEAPAAFYFYSDDE